MEDITLGSLEAKTMSNMVTNWFERTGSKSLSTKESKIPKCSSTVHPAAQQFKEYAPALGNTNNRDEISNEIRSNYNDNDLKDFH